MRNSAFSVARAHQFYLGQYPGKIQNVNMSEATLTFWILEASQVEWWAGRVILRLGYDMENYYAR